MFPIYAWSLLGVILVNILLLFLEEEVLEYLPSRILQWLLNLVLVLLFLHYSLQQGHFLIALLHQICFSTAILFLTLAIPRIFEELMGYGNPEEMCVGPWFVLVSIFLSLAWGGIPKLITLPGFKILWQEIPGLLFFFLLGQILISALALYIEDLFEQPLAGNLLGAFFSFLFTLALVFVVQEKLSAHGVDVFLVSFILVSLSLTFWLLVPFISELFLEVGHLDALRVKLGILYSLLAFFIAGIVASMSWFQSVGSTLYQYLQYLGF